MHGKRNVGNTIPIKVSGGNRAIIIAQLRGHIKKRSGPLALPVTVPDSRPSFVTRRVSSRCGKDIQVTIIVHIVDGKVLAPLAARRQAA